ncbi:hypothetical protein I302_106839 [Kwoniella bestiolae CBS 10118]|uniref:Uncharacterized protein n=1 Tax=Kwoniella bestiolae CBS 10118 TaxID=1296100 RepID=A0A1B9G084_9TREE|nr:hypothetical protein I302_05896 [Kwoniella bestiolae CBS 10118]OCF24436.1 hypothetical protein I302_05896 [Kwoniella bestiolae CBS 10118]
MSFLPYTYSPSFSPYPSYSYPFSQSLSTPSPIYTILIVGMVLFMAANVMPNLLPAADRVWHVAPMVIQWGFIIIIFALMVQMLGIVPGVPQLHITYVHMAIASLLFILMWNHIVSEIPPPAEEKRSSSSSSSRDKPSEKKEEKKKEDGPTEPSPWDDLRSHPSAFLTTRLNKLMPWPFPLGRANRVGNELWWEKGMPSHVGHFNKPDPEIEKKAKEEEARKKKEKERAKLKEEEKAKEAEKLKEKEKAKKEAEEKAKMREEEMRKAKEEARRRKEEMERKKVEDKHKQKLWRTKYLAMIIGISLLNKTLGFLLLLLFSLQMVSQELNEAPPAASSSSSSPSSSSSSSSSGSSSLRSSSSSSPSSQEEKEKLAKLAAQKEKEKAAAASKSSSSSRDPSKSSSSSSSSKEPSKSSSSSTSSSSKSSSSSSSSKDPISSDAVRKASGSKTVTSVDPEGGSFGVPYTVGFGMSYIHTPNPDKKDDLTLPSMTIPSTGMSHPLMTTTYRQYAN